MSRKQIINLVNICMLVFGIFFMFLPNPEQILYHGSCYTTYDDGVISVTSDKQSITNTFEETFKKFEV